MEEIIELIKELKKDLKGIDDKIDILYASDILNKEILNDHEKRIIEISKK